MLRGERKKDSPSSSSFSSYIFFCPFFCLNCFSSCWVSLFYVCVACRTNWVEEYSALSEQGLVIAWQLPTEITPYCPMKYYRGLLLLLLFLLCVYILRSSARSTLVVLVVVYERPRSLFFLFSPLVFSFFLFYSSTNILSFGKQKRPSVLLLFYYFKGKKKRDRTKKENALSPSLVLNIVVQFCGNSL